MFCKKASRNILNFRIWITFAVLLLAPAPAWAHRQATAYETPACGVSIPNIAHGQMAIMAAHTHAYLAATRALLLHLHEMTGGDRAAVRALATTIEQQLLDEGTSLVMCRYSDEPFNTAEVIGTHWSSIPSHLPSLVTLAALALTILGCATMAVRKSPS
jgi:hypothetical protein